MILFLKLSGVLILFGFIGAVIFILTRETIKSIWRFFQ